MSNAKKGKQPASAGPSPDVNRTLRVAWTVEPTAPVGKPGVLKPVHAKGSVLIARNKYVVTEARPSSFQLDEIMVHN
jgi:hypothetical protein